MESTDPKQKELIEGELKKAQQSWSECSNRLAFINMEIERFTKGGEANMRIEEKQVMCDPISLFEIWRIQCYDIIRFGGNLSVLYMVHSYDSIRHTSTRLRGRL